MKNLKLSNNINLINKKFKNNQYYHYLKTPNLSLVIPIINNKIIVVSQKKIPINKINYEFPCGNIEKNETPLITAKKELLEETGFESNKFIKVISFYTEPGRLTSKMNVFFSKELIKIGNPEKGIKIHLFDKRKIFELIKNNRFNNSSHIAAFLFFLNQRIT